MLVFYAIIYIENYSYFRTMVTRGKIKRTTRKRAPRKCSICGRNGHNARTCDTATKQRLQATQKRKIEETSKSSHVSVQVTPQIETSPHVVRIAPQQKTRHWEDAKVYQAKKIKRQRTTVDFAHMVKTANTSDDTTKEPQIDILEEISKIRRQRPFRDTVSAQKGLKMIGAKKPSLVARAVQSSIDRVQDTGERVSHTTQSIKDQFHFRKFALSAVAMIMLLALPFPAVGFYNKLQDDTARIVAESTNAFLSLQSSTVSAFHNNIPQAQYDLTAALNSFSNAEEIIDKEYKALVYVARLLPFVGNQVKSRQELLLAGHHVALGNTYLVKGFGEVAEREDVPLLDRLLLLQQHMRSAIPQYEEALSRIDSVDPRVLPEEYQGSFEDFRVLFAALIDDMTEMDSVVEGVHAMLGGESLKRYLVLFQNHHEIRPTGGFVGSYAVLDVQQGKILDITVPGGGSYDLQGQLDTFVKPPLPLQVVNSRWEFQDGNWFPDFEASAQKMAWFYQHSRNSTVDGVIAVNSTVLERLLKVIGPIENKDHDIILAGEKALETLQYHVETYDNEEENTPKAVLSVLLEQMMDKIADIDAASVVSLVNELHSALGEKEIQVYFEDEEVQTLFEEYGWTGNISETPATQDYLMVVNTNLHGGKSDAKINQHIHHQAVIQDDGSVIDTVLVTRMHDGEGDLEIFDRANSSYLRLYVPEGAELLDAGGFVYPDETAFDVSPAWYEDDPDVRRIERNEEIHVDTGTRITEEFGKTVFANWIVTQPGEETQVYFTYRLPFNVYQDGGVRVESGGEIASLIKKAQGQESLSRYSVVLQKQSGAYTDLSHAVIYPDGWVPVWQSGTDDMDISVNGAQVEGPFKTDKAYGIIMKKN